MYKERIYSIKKRHAGRWMFESIYDWAAYTQWHECVATGRTKAECIREARDRGYIVGREVI